MQRIGQLPQLTSIPRPRLPLVAVGVVCWSLRGIVQPLLRQLGSSLREAQLTFFVMMKLDLWEVSEAATPRWLAHRNTPGVAGQRRDEDNGLHVPDSGGRGESER